MNVVIWWKSISSNTAFWRLFGWSLICILYVTSVYAVDTFFLLLSILHISIIQQLARHTDIFDVTLLTLSRAVVISDRIMKRAFSPLSFSYNGNMIEQINNFLIYAPYFGSIQRGEICICSIVEDEDGRNLYRRLL